MNITFKNITKAFLVAALSALALTSCSEWTETESLKFEYTTLEEKNPELYQAYMESLRTYRETDHKVMIAKFDNKSTMPSGCADHINCVPDSTDYVVLTNTSDLSEQLLADMQDLKENKKTRVLGQIDIELILTDYKAYREKWLEDHAPEAATAEEGGDAPVDVMLDFVGYIAEKMPSVMEPFNKYPYDGINVKYSGRNPESCTPEMLENLKAEQSAFFGPVMEWLRQNDDRLFFLEGTPHYLALEDELIDRADYILLPTQSAMLLSEFTHVVNKVIVDKRIPSDKIVPVVTTISLLDPSIKEGHFSAKNPDGSEMSAIVGAAYWNNEIFENFIPQGIAVEHAQNDYFNLHQVYSEIRSAIGIMNPSPLN